MTSDRVYNVLFLCTGNSARSIMAESIMNADPRKRFVGYSAGSQPRGTIDPQVIDLLQRSNQPTTDLRSKSWDEFSGPDAPQMDFVFTVCDETANEVCPTWPGQPMSPHWGLPDPATFEGSEAERRVFVADVFRMLTNRISIFMLHGAAARVTRSPDPAEAARRDRRPRGRVMPARPLPASGRSA